MYPPSRHAIPFHRSLLATLSVYRSSYKRIPIKQRLWNLVTLRNILLVVWIAVLYWGERKVFRDSLEDCQWDKWEKWPSNAAPYRMALIADPQLVDPHTYPRRGIALRATIFYTDKYMEKSYSLLNSILIPQTTIFLGDLFDGGREWSTGGGSWKFHMVDPRAETDWVSYGRAYWEGEFLRFNKIFPVFPGRRSIRSLPGNHDLGIGNGIDEGVVSRFKAFFGETNSVHTLGNHTFVLIDSVSLENTQNKNIYEPTTKFLDEFPNFLPSPLELLRETPQLRSTKIQEANEPPPTAPTEQVVAASLPRILLTHVPLYRPPNTPCGPLRESSHQAIFLQGGFQYQNVLTSEISGDVLRKVQPVLVASGDDHDYCEVLHAGATGMVKEITVKSFSWVMGVRKPGFLLVSLWNPITIDNQKSPDGSTIQTKLCLLPDQWGIFKVYILAFGVTKFILTLNLIYLWLRKKRNEPLLPLSQDEAGKLQSQKAAYKGSEYGFSSVSSWNGSNGSISTRIGASSGGSGSHLKPHGHSHYGGYGIPSTSPSPAPYNDDDDDKYAKKSVGLGLASMPNLPHNINTHLTQLGNAAGNVGSMVADRVAERVPSLAPMVENGKEIVRREIEKGGGVSGWVQRLWRTALEWSVFVVIVGIWYLWLVNTSV